MQCMSLTPRCRQQHPGNWSASDAIPAGPQASTLCPSDPGRPGENQKPFRVPSSFHDSRREALCDLDSFHQANESLQMENHVSQSAPVEVP